MAISWIELSSDSKDVITLVMGLIATLSALVLAPQITSAKTSFDTQRNEVIQIAADFMQLDRVLAHYGPETRGARIFLRSMIANSIDTGGPRTYEGTNPVPRPSAAARTISARKSSNLNRATISNARFLPKPGGSAPSSGESARYYSGREVAGVRSVGTICAIALFTAGDNDPLFLQIKQAKASVLEPYAGEPYAGKSRHPNDGQRVVNGQRLMQSASDTFLGWTEGREGRNFYIRQLHDVKVSPILETMDADLLGAYVQACALSLARARARSGDAAMISGYMGSRQTFDEAICEFAVEYADQTERDYENFVKPVRNKKIDAMVEK